MPVQIRQAIAADAEACGRVMHAAFRGIAERHGFEPDILSDEAGAGLAATLIASPNTFVVVAETDGQIIGSNFLHLGDPIRAIGPITVNPPQQRAGVGRRLMEAALEHAGSGTPVRLCGDAFNTQSVGLYASLGFEIKEPLLLMHGRCREATSDARLMTENDIPACTRLCNAVYGTTRSVELGEALQAFRPVLVERQGVVSGYMSAPNLWLMNHGVGQSERDFQALIAGASGVSQEPVSFLLPVRQASLFRWCLSQGLRVAKPMALMALGDYSEPKGAWFPSVFY
ncbi:GNAT family N-acetyltransferase [Belnapia sp. T6]|uniref:GNAT family N-acetyltransferase n=1 Tax=Belnapia mucosa TaxID=2804532 RepID=A0ABS1VC54_9PROT|nr:GNAT family N-acetyltransferase [Belnapia mucosa]MBL6459270.1 GNAT family N-acetyltransferase [Belnapia mucosa]